MSGGAGGGGGSSAFGVGVTGIFTGLETRAASISISYTAVPTAKKCKKKKHRSASSAKKKKCKKKKR